MEKMKLVLGAAGKKHDDALTLDIDEKHAPDVVHDLNNLPWPFKENQFKEIVCHHVLEHLHSIDGAMRELYRICAPDGTIYIEVPHHTSWCANVPEHHLRFNYFALDGYIADGKEQAWISTDKKFRLLSREVTFHKSFRRLFLHKLFNAFPKDYERFWSYTFPAEHIKFILQPIKKDS
jgi:ubiquinone/menaquinone biosynthesis C-methylase UbiE